MVVFKTFWSHIIIQKEANPAFKSLSLSKILEKIKEILFDLNKFECSTTPQTGFVNNSILWFRELNSGWKCWNKNCSVICGPECSNMLNLAIYPFDINNVILCSNHLKISKTKFRYANEDFGDMSQAKTGDLLPERAVEMKLNFIESDKLLKKSMEYLNSEYDLLVNAMDDVWDEYLDHV